jgi:periplasmic protein TonB
MTAYAADEHDDRIAAGLAGAVALHALLAAAFIAAALYVHTSSDHWGEKASEAGAIQASMVSAIPLPSKVKPVDKSVLAPDVASPAPIPPPKEAAIPPPRDTDILVKGKTQPAKTAPIPALNPPKHPQPIPDTAKAQSGDSATQLPQSITQTKNGDAAATIEDKAFGAHYAYYRDIVSRTVSQNWYTTEADPRASQGKHVIVVMDIQRDGSPTNVRVQTRSGSPTLDTSALRAIQRIDTFGPLPSGDHVTVELSFDFHQP